MIEFRSIDLVAFVALAGLWVVIFSGLFGLRRWLRGRRPDDGDGHLGL